MNATFSTLRFAAAVVLPLVCGGANAQFGVNFPGLTSLPQDDFTWQWGNPERAGGFDDFSMRGNEGGFRCTLTGKLSAAARMSPGDVREMENDLRTTLYFIQAATNAMNVLDARRDLDWAVLDCDKPEPRERSAAEREAREEEARQKAVERMLRRREREARREAREED